MSPNMRRIRVSRLSRSDAGINSPNRFREESRTDFASCIVDADRSTDGVPPMLTAEGCRQRRMRLWERLGSSGIERLALADPIHLRYFANADFDPINLAADMPAVLLISREGRATLVLDRRSPDVV